MTIPDWWLYISAAFFVLNIFLLIGLIIAIIKIVGVIKDLQPKIEQLTEKVEGVAQKVDALATSTKETVDAVGGRAREISTSIQRITNTAAVQFERFSPILIGGMTVLRLLGALRQYRQGGAKHEDQEEEHED